MKRLAALFLLIPAMLHAQDAKQDFVFSATEENDLFVLPETDKHYTQGLHFSLMWPDDEVPIAAHPLSWTPPLGLPNPIRKFGFEVGQDIYTPKNTRTSTLRRDDRPYAGWLFVGFLREDRSHTGIPTLDRYELQLGVIGSISLAEDAQNWWHANIGSDEANGWNHQLKNEPGILLRLDRKWRLMDIGDNELRIQMLPHAGLALGNVQTSARLGTTLRVGHHIPDEFAALIPPTFGWYVFSDVTARAVLYNAFLDGNSYRSSHSVDKEPVVIELRGGIVLELGPNEISYTYVYLNREFKLQDKHDAYASLNYTYRF